MLDISFLLLNVVRVIRYLTLNFEKPYFASQIDISHLTLTLDLPFNGFYHVCNKRNMYKKLRHHLKRIMKRTRS